MSIYWNEAAAFCHDTFGTHVNYKKRVFICPECGQLVKESDWSGVEMDICPLCGVMFENM